MAMPFIEPMAALLVKSLPEGREWLYEAKFDGYRALAIKNGKAVRLLSRKGHDLTRRYPAVERAIAGLKTDDAMLDGEIVAFDENGRPSFQLLQHGLARGTAVRYFAFDLLFKNGTDLRDRPLQDRRRLLAELVDGSSVDFSDELAGSASAVLAAVREVGLEGVVAKRRESRYEAGRRSGAWQKVRIQLRQECVIGGYKPLGSSFEALVVGYYETGMLKFAGRVRAGFTPALRDAVFARVRPLLSPVCPFGDLPTGKRGRWGEGVTEQDMKMLRWVRPVLVAEVAFTEWTMDGHLRHSSFVALRDDKDAHLVVREDR